MPPKIKNTASTNNPGTKKVNLDLRRLFPGVGGCRSFCPGGIANPHLPNGPVMPRKPSPNCLNMTNITEGPQATPVGRDAESLGSQR